jgi:hypothetical protein
VPTKTKYASPRLELEVTPEIWDEAVRASSGGCLIAEAIRRQYPQFTGVRVDMATVRLTDRKKGLRFMYLTPPPAQHLLLAFDQGWGQPTEGVKIARAVKVTPVTRARTRARAREARVAELEAKKAGPGGLTRTEKSTLSRLKKAARGAAKRPSSYGPASANRDGVVHGGRPSVQGPPHPNLLRGRDRHFGAKTAKPAEAFQEAVDKAVAEKLAGAP